MNSLHNIHDASRTNGVSEEKTIGIYMTGGWGYGNLGDNAILKGTVSGLDSLAEAVNKHVNLVITSFSVEETKERNGLESIPSIHSLLSFRKPTSYLRWLGILLWQKTGKPIYLSPSLRRHLTAMASAKVVLFAGGGYFNDVWKDALPARLIEFEFAKASNSPYVVVGQTIGPFSRANVVGKLAQALRRAEFVAFRDARSLESLELAGLRSEQLHYTADMAHLIPTGNVERHEVQPQASGQERTVRVGLVFQTHRSYGTPSGLLPYGRYSTSNDYCEALLSTVARLNRDLRAQFVIVPSTSRNEEFTREMFNNMVAAGMSVEFAEVQNGLIERFVEVCQSCDVMLSTNMHPCILATLAGIPTVALTYNFKFDDYMTRIGRGGYCHRIDDFDSELVAKDVVTGAYMNDKSRAELKTRANQVTTSAWDNVNLLSSVI